MSTDEDTLEDLWEELETGTEETEDLDTDDETGDGTSSDDEKGNWEKRYKDEQKFLQESREELKAVKAELQQMRQENQDDIPDYFDDEKLADSVRDDPAEALKLFKQLRDDVVLTLQERDKLLMKEISKQSPEARELAPVVQQLRDDDDYAAFSDDQLYVLAKKMTSDGDESTKIKRAYKPSSSKRASQKKEKDVTKTRMWQKVYGDFFDED